MIKVVRVRDVMWPLYSLNCSTCFLYQIILLETGVRISELCGFTTHLNFKKCSILINRQLLQDTEVGFYTESPKTKKVRVKST